MTGEQIIGLILSIIVFAAAIVIGGFAVVWLFLKIIDIGIGVVDDAWWDLRITWDDVFNTNNKKENAK